MKPPFTADDCGQYGASMGRRSDVLQPAEGGRVALRRVPIDSGGYDPGGAYWGIGPPLFCAWTEDGQVAYLRAASRDAAKALLLSESSDPENMKFYR